MIKNKMKDDKIKGMNEIERLRSMKSTNKSVIVSIPELCGCQFLCSSAPGGRLGVVPVERRRPEEEAPRAHLRPAASCCLHPPPPAGRRDVMRPYRSVTTSSRRRGRPLRPEPTRPSQRSVGGFDFSSHTFRQPLTDSPPRVIFPFIKGATRDVHLIKLQEKQTLFCAELVAW